MPCSAIPEGPKETNKCTSGPSLSHQGEEFNSVYQIMCAKHKSPHVPEAEQPLKIRIRRPINTNMNSGPLVTAAPTSHSHLSEVEARPRQAEASDTDLSDPQDMMVELPESQGKEGRPKKRPAITTTVTFKLDPASNVALDAERSQARLAQKFAKESCAAFTKKVTPACTHSSRQEFHGQWAYRRRSTNVQEGTCTTKGSNMAPKIAPAPQKAANSAQKKAPARLAQKKAPATSASKKATTLAAKTPAPQALQAVSTTTTLSQPTPLTDTDWERMEARGAAYWKAHWESQRVKDALAPKPSQDVVAKTESLPVQLPLQSQQKGTNEAVASVSGCRRSSRRTVTLVP
ncbi:hypothetical protein PSTT_11447 [Puccinia striiformis]|uniref:Uncharacterized protein n=1 Tax=Puccinia striiformis TaxID=27350 RepID=A0A2S4V077_9BASI|nr:hypothetical protein PSTT_11447 [Puccinia striiformis]